MMVKHWRNIAMAVALACTAPAAAADRLPLNEASADQLAALEGVGNAAAASIVALRTARGQLNSIEELRVIRELPAEGLDSLRRHTEVSVEFPVGQVKTYNTPEEVLAEFDSEPTIQQVQAWANDYADMNPAMVQRWLRASKSFAALPQLTVEYEFKDGWDQDFIYFDADGAALTSPEQEPLAVFQDAGRDQDAKYKVRAVWQLSDLVMSSERIRVIGESQKIVKLRDTVLTEVTKLYFERRRLQAEALLKPKSDVLGQVKDQLRLMEFTANIDALTGGAFSAGVARSGQ